MKTCTRCKQGKTLDSFAKKSSAKDGLASWCKSCFAEHAKIKWHSGDKERKLANRYKTVSANQQRLVAYLLLNPCVDCGLDDIRCLTFDHIDPSTKTRNVSEMMQWGWETISKEIAKCEVRCANCHMVRTGVQFKYWKTK